MKPLRANYICPQCGADMDGYQDIGGDIVFTHECPAPPAPAYDDDGANVCWSCDRPLKEGESEACARCWVDPTVTPVTAQEPDAARREALEASAALEAAEAVYNELDRRCQDLRYYADSAEDWQAYGEACRQRREAHVAVEAAFDRWQAARQAA